MFDGICDAIYRELEQMDEKLGSGKAPLTSQDLEHIDKMAHAIKSLATYEAMKERDGYVKERIRTGRYEEPYYRRY